MASLIINEGSGPRSVDLRGPVVIGSNPSCDVVLDHPTATGSRVELQPKRFGYRVTKLKGDLLVNEQAADMADLEHNDTLRIGEVLLLYKQPEGDAFDGSAAPSAARVEVLPDGQEDEIVDDLLDAELEALEPADLSASAPPPALDDALERARLKRLEALRRLQLAEHGAPIDELPDLAAPGALLEAAALDVDEERALEALAHEHGLEEAAFKEILAAADHAASAHERDQPLEIVELEALEELAVEPPPEIDEALERAQLKRLAALDVLARAGAGAPREPLPDLSDAQVLDAMRALRAAGAAEALLAYERAEHLDDETPRGLLERAESLWTAREDAERAAREAEAAASAELEALDELEELTELEALGDLAEIESSEDLTALEGLDEQALDAADEFAAGDLAELEELEALPPVDAPAPTPVERRPALAPRAAAGGPRAVRALAPARGTPSAPMRAAQPAAAVFRVAPPVGARGAVPAGARPLPVEGIAFTRPLPPGRAAPTYLPPVHPGSPPA
ncbi:MAG: hypothetical protein H6825_00830 [Planctomycetes bacterium]|nr:hypothetical protein [Planctomycetota bacterium]